MCIIDKQAPATEIQNEQDEKMQNSFMFCNNGFYHLVTR